ncbi:unnamed protein product [Linum trigynum]|uniref:Uncharacterized protein n=1 Tax=Linum trigynum TaxID=586398 RepID=A0AAV2FAC4_9ROSI
MRRSLFLRIVEGVMNQEPFFQSNHDTTGKSSLSPLQKCTTTIRILAYGVAADAVDEYLRIGESTTALCVKKFVRAFNVVFGEEYLRSPNAADVEHFLHVGEQRDEDVNFEVSMPTVSQNHLPEYDEYLRNHTRIRNRSTNNQLQSDTIEEIWNGFGDEEYDD